MTESSGFSTSLLPATAGGAKEYLVDFDISPDEVNAAVAERSGSEPITPDLVGPDEVLRPEFYKRLANGEAKEQYRERVRNSLQAKWRELHGEERAGKLLRQFQQLTENFDKYGALIFGALLPNSKFEGLVRRYTELLASHGSKTWIHTYINLANHPDFLTDQELNDPFLHPLLVALISYRIGGPIRIVDARGKDAQPISILAQDNMLHIDNTPFNDEYKILLTWEKDRASGPKGQNFVFVPGTHKGCRNCFSAGNGAWSTENASIFTTPERINRILSFQEDVFESPSRKPMVVEATHAEKPLTIVFPSGSLIHHRYRTPQGLARSCLIIAFHLQRDNPGELVPPEHLWGLVEPGSLLACLFGQHSLSQNGDVVGAFLQALSRESETIGVALEQINSDRDCAEEIKPETCQLKPEEIEKWKADSTSAPTVEKLKGEADLIPLGARLSPQEMLELVGKMMVWDKHGPLDLILYHDNHEEIRKWARNQIREKQVAEVREHLRGRWIERVGQPSKEQLLSPRQLKDCAEQLAAFLEEAAARDSVVAALKEGEKISCANACKSVRQLLLDLGESITRCEDCQAFLSTSLFIFWACDAVVSLGVLSCDSQTQSIGDKLLANYLATSILFEKRAPA